MTEPGQQAAEVAANLAEVRARIDGGRAAGRARPGRGDAVAVSKSQPEARIEAALAAGQRVFGENYVQEAAGRWPELRQRWPGVELHLIGGLQSNKAAEAVALFDVIQTLDRPKLARELAKEMARQGAPAAAARPGQHRRGAAEVGHRAGRARRPSSALCRDELGLAVEGLMAIPPEDEDVALHAALLAKLAARAGLAPVSIGMSGDYETAIRFGATHVRVGTAIFGARRARRER